MIKFRSGPPKSKDSKGTPYVLLVSGGLKEEAEPPPQYAETAEEAWASYWSALTDYLGEQAATVIEWRSPPTLQGQGDKLWVRSRLSVVGSEA